MRNLKRETKIKLMQLAVTLGLVLIFWMVFNVILNYTFLALDGMGQALNNRLPEGHFAFRPEYLITIKRGMPVVSTLIFAAVLGLLGGYKLNRRLAGHFFPNDSVEGTSRWATEKEIREYLVPVPKNNIKTANESGIVLAADKNNYYIDPNTVISLIVGATRSGKGQLSVLYLIRQLSQGKMKQSMVVNDPKGELLENSYQMLRQAGYRIVILNFRDTNVSSGWNPLSLIIEAYTEGVKAGDISKAAELIGELAKILTDNPKSDPIWPESAQALLEAIILYLLEQGLEHGCLDKVNMYSVYNFFLEYGSKNYLIGKCIVNALDELFQNLPVGNPAKLAYASSNFAKGEMRSSIFSTLATNLKIFSDAGIARITSGDDIRFEDLADFFHPCAVFMVVPDEKINRHVLASLFVDQCYSSLVDIASRFPGQKLPRRVQFILDEFGNMVRIPSMDVKITVALGRNILFNLYIQSFSQLEGRYGKDAAGTILDNCGNLVYINSLSHETNERISRLLGNRTEQYATTNGSMDNLLNSNEMTHLKARPLLTPDELAHLEFGEMVAIRQRCYPILTKMEPFYTLCIPVTPIKDIPLERKVFPLSDILFPLEYLERKALPLPDFLVPLEHLEPDTGEDDSGDVQEPEEDSYIQPLLDVVNTLTKGQFGKALNIQEWDGCKRMLELLCRQGKMREEDIQALSQWIDEVSEEPPVIMPEPEEIIQMMEQQKSAYSTPPEETSAEYGNY